MTKKKNDPSRRGETEVDKIKDLEQSLLRAQADFDNYRKRTEAQKLEMVNFAKADFMAKITPVLDNFRRAFSHLDINDPKIAGVKQIEKQLEDILTAEGLEKIPAESGTKFDPNIHEAISFEENKIKPDHIISELESGWMFNGKVLKPAKVRVSKGK